MPVYTHEMIRELGGEMLEIRDGYAKAQLPLSEKVMQPTRVYHAGAIVALADEAASAAIVGERLDTCDMGDKKFPYSIQLSVNLLTNDPVGPIVAEATVVKRGRITVVDTIVKTCTGETAAMMRSSHFMVDPNKTGPHHKK
ncbi:PaaI family thioesterase [Candidatus Obscuribacterales bacterium]|nr:PaaI family thioesterase [Candidatus Obscuribacterales bacterium]MBX3137860.1 PaaI family thioesterase [Candidatus Obscuribacterales bacterium]MBX3153039.1 PaaI family thioesterase [Candidatus Obscuribacterales bacterium]